MCLNAFFVVVITFCSSTSDFNWKTCIASMLCLPIGRFSFTPFCFKIFLSTKHYPELDHKFYFFLFNVVVALLFPFFLTKTSKCSQEEERKKKESVLCAEMQLPLFSLTSHLKESFIRWLTWPTLLLSAQAELGNKLFWLRNQSALQFAQVVHGLGKKQCGWWSCNAT